jgi:hypothetical protein
MGIQIIICVSIVVIVWFAGKANMTADMELINGMVTGKAKVKVSCSHSYQCNCITTCSGSGSTRSCTTICQTCYDHPYDYDWRVYTSMFNRKSFNIRRINSQGTKEPPRWTKIEKGDPTTAEHGYTNYVKAVPRSLFNMTTDVDDYKDKIPEYPRVYDYYRVNRILTIDMGLPDAVKWNKDLSEILKLLGPMKEANIIIIAVKIDDPKYKYAVENAWLHGKKNDIVIFLGTNDGKTFAWVDVMSWAKNDIFNVELKDALYRIGAFDRVKVMATIKDITSRLFVRRSMEEFKYLENEIEPEPWVQMLAGVLGIVMSIIATLVMHYVDVDEMIFGRGHRMYGRKNRYSHLKRR